MVDTQTKNQNIFWLWSDEVDCVSNCGVLHWMPIYVELDKKLSDELKSGKAKRLKDIAFVDYGFMPLEDYTTPDLGKALIRVTNIKGDGIIEMGDVKYVPINDRVHEKLVKEGDSLVVQCGNTTGKIGFITKELEELVYPSFCLLARPTGINPYALNVILSSSIVQTQLQRGMDYNSVRPNTTKPEVENLIIPVLTKFDQQKVEQIVKEAFQLKKDAESEYQEAVNIFVKNLKIYIPEWEALTTGKETAFWLWSNEIDMVSRIDPDYYSGKGIKSKLGKTKPLGDLAEIKIGKTLAFDDYLNSGKRRIMKFRAITGRGIDWENEERGFVKEEFFQKNKQNRLRSNDIVLGSAAHQAHYIGKYIDIIDEIPKEFRDGVLTVAEIMTIRTGSDILNPFVLLLFLRSKVGYEFIQRQIKGQTSHLYPKDVVGIEIPEAITKLSKSAVGVEIESKIKSSLEKSRLNKQKLQEAKELVENLI